MPCFRRGHALRRYRHSSPTNSYAAAFAGPSLILPPVFIGISPRWQAAIASFASSRCCCQLPGEMLAIAEASSSRRRARCTGYHDSGHFIAILPLTASLFQDSYDIDAIAFSCSDGWLDCRGRRLPPSSARLHFAEPRSRLSARLRRRRCWPDKPVAPRTYRRRAPL